MVSAQSGINTPFLFNTGEAWVAFCARIPLLGIPFRHWQEISQPQLTLLFPGLLVGGLGCVVVWFWLSLGAAWQNSNLFSPALRRLGWSLMPLILYGPLGLMNCQGETWFGHVCVMLPFAVTAFLLAWMIRKTREEALGDTVRIREQEEGESVLAGILVWMAALMAFLLWASFSLLRHNNYHSHGYDMALINHPLCRFVMGDGMDTSLLLSGNGSLIQPLSPFLFVLSPLYYFGPHPETLLLVQAAAVAFAAVPLYGLAKQFLGSSWAACAIALCYLLLPGLSEGIYSDFHTQSVAPFLFFWFARETVRPGSRRWWVPMVLVWLVSETLFLYTLAWGVFLLVKAVVKRAHPSRATAIGIASLVVFLSLVYPSVMYGYLQPRLYPNATAETCFVERYKDFLPEWMNPASKGLPDLVWNIASNPLIALSLIFDPQRLEVFLRYWGGVMFLPLWNPMAWLPLAAVMENTLSSDGFMFTWAGASGFAPMMMTAVAMVISLALLRRWRSSRGWVTPLSWVMLFSSLVWWMGDYATRSMSPPPWVRYAVRMAPEGTTNILSTQLVLGKSVSAQSHLVPHLVHESQIYLLPPSTPEPAEGVPPEAPEFECLQPKAGWPHYLILDRVASNPKDWYNLWFFDQPKILAWIDWLVQTGRYRKTQAQGTLEIYERLGE